MLSLSKKLSLTTQPIYRFVNEHSVDFDGVDDRIITDGEVVQYEHATYSFWCKASETGQNAGVFGHGDLTQGCFNFNYSSNKPSLFLNGNNYYRYWNDTSAQDDGEWHHWVVYVCQSDITNSKLWVDGVLQNPSTTDSTGSANPYTETLTIGSDRQVGGNSFEGRIDEFAVYDRELTQAEVTRMFNTYFSPNRIANGNFSQIGNELVTNGDFASATGWNTSGGGTISDGKAYIVGDGSAFTNISQSGVFTSGKQYKVTVDVTINSGLGLKFQDGSNNENIGFATTSGSYTFYFASTSNTTLVIGRRTGGTAFDSSIDNISVKEVGQHWSFGDGWTPDQENSRATKSGSATSVIETNPSFNAISGKTYKVQVVVSDVTTGNFRIDAPLGDGVTKTASESFNYTIVAASSGYFRITGWNGFDGSVSNVVVQELKHDATNLMLNAGAYQSANPLITSTKSMEFDGTDDYLQLSEPFSHNNHTICAWINSSNYIYTYQYGIFCC